MDYGTLRAALRRQVFRRLTPRNGIAAVAMVVASTASGQLVSQPLGTRECTAEIPFPISTCSVLPNNELGQPLGTIALRQHGWHCEIGQTECSGNFPVSVGGNGAAVESFYTLRHDPNAKEIAIAWHCPNPKYSVMVTVRVDERTWQWTGLCGQNTTGNAFKLSEFSRVKDGLLFARVQVVTTLSCATNAYLVAQVTAPNSYFKPSEYYCGPVNSKACLVVRSTLGYPNAWVIEAGDAKKTGYDKMDSVGVPVSAPGRCEFVPAYAGAVGDNQNSKQKTVIGELWF
jgi:hypothetical protein